MTDLFFFSIYSERWRGRRIPSYTKLAIIVVATSGGENEIHSISSNTKLL